MTLIVTGPGAVIRGATVSAGITAPASNVANVWKARVNLKKYDDAGNFLEEINTEDNLLMYGGASCLLESLLGNGTATSGQSLTFFNNGNAYIGVGDSTTAAAATQTALQAATNKVRIAMNSTYPSHTDGTTSGAASVTFQSTFGSSDGNFDWNEWGVFNGSSGGRMLVRKVESLGTKSSGSWVFTVTFTIS